MCVGNGHYVRIPGFDSPTASNAIDLPQCTRIEENIFSPNYIFTLTTYEYIIALIVSFHRILE